MKPRIASFMAACALALAAGLAHGQSPYPSRPIKFIAPFPPGGSSDVIGRLLGQKLAESLGQPVIVENRPGASAAIGHEYVAKQPADGYTLILSSSSALVTNALLKKHLGYDPVHDFAPISMVASAGQVLVVNPSLPVRNVQELIALARAQPGKLNYGSGGIGIASHLAAETFKAAAEVNIVHVPYKGTGQAVADAAAGNVQLVFADMVPALPQLRSGRLRALAVTTAERSAALPEVPTMSEAGLPGFRSGVWWAVTAPRGLSEAIVARLNAEIGRIVALPDVREKYAALGVTPEHSTPQEVSARIVSDTRSVAQVLKAAGVKAE
jgi:tripartite-type tricarboxylate transporter receptor subunit TctC